MQGRAFDSRGEPIVKASVWFDHKKLETTTDTSGRIEFRGVNSGQVEVYVSTVGYVLIKRETQLQPDAELLQKALRRSDEINFTSEVFDSHEPNEVSENTLNNTELYSAAKIDHGFTSRIDIKVPPGRYRI